MSEVRYLKDRLGLYLLFLGLIAAFTVIVALLPYGTIYLRQRAYLSVFIGVMVACIAVFLLGTVHNFMIWMQGKGLVGAPERRLLKAAIRGLRYVLAKRIVKSISVFVRDSLYLSKLKERSATRWAMHILILGGFALMFAMDLVVTFSLDVMKFGPMIDPDGWAKLWIRDFAFDLAGLMMLSGLLIAVVRRFVIRPKIVRTELPDAASVLFLLAVVAGGFYLEGMGIAAGIPGHLTGNSYSFVGQLFSYAVPSGIGQYYDQAWLLHGVMSALLIAYIPFSKLFHMIATPIAIEVERLSSPEARQ